MTRTYKMRTFAMLVTTFATLAVTIPHQAKASVATNDQANFETFTKSNPAYVFYSKDDAQNCRLNISVSDKGNHPQSDTSTCHTLYSLAKASGEREFIFFTDTRVLSIIAPPGGINHKDGTHWAVSEVTIFSRNKTEPTVHWNTPGTCISKPSEKITCLIDDKKVKISIGPTTLKNNEIIK